MAVAKKNTYVDSDLDWLEQRLADIKSSVDANPYHKIKDRKVSLDGPNGAAEKVSATIETQQKSIREALKDYALIVEAVSKLRQLEDEKDKKIRGNEDLTPMESGDI